MAGEELPPTTGERLYFEQGWRQGSLFFPSQEVGQAYWVVRDGVFQQCVLEEHERLILITQDCDLVAIDEKEPFVEVLACIEMPGIGANRNSSRLFQVDGDRHLVAAQPTRRKLRKEILLPIAPDPWPGTPQAFHAFLRFLGGRYTRVALESAVDESFRKPFEDALRKRIKTPGVQSFNQCVEEFMIKINKLEDGRYRLGPHFILAEDADQEETAEAVQAVWSLIQESCDGSRIQLVTPEVWRPSEIPLSRYRDLIKVPLDHYSYRGEEVVGAVPPVGMD